MSLKFRRLLVIYTLAALVALSAYSVAAAKELQSARRMTGYASARAFEEAVTAADGLSAALRKLAYTSDPALGKSLCAQAYADAMAAEAALSVLPFSTQELEKLQGFLGRAGDYAGTLCALAETRLSDEHRGHLHDLGEAAADFAGQLRSMQSKLHDGSVTMDERQAHVYNVSADGEGQKLSALLLGYEDDFRAPEAFFYDGRYSPAQKNAAGSLTEDEARAAAALAAGVEPRELREEFDYEGPEGRRCYSAGRLLLGVSSRGLEFMAQSRLVSETKLTMDEAQKTAEEFLTRMGFEAERYAGQERGSIAAFVYAPAQDGVMRPDDALNISVALDDGSIYAFDATRWSPEPVELNWSIGETDALATLPEGVNGEFARRLILKSPGGSYRPCWEILCTGEEGERALVYVDAETGRQRKVELIEDRKESEPAAAAGTGQHG